ncbi:MAG: hypothetical protein HYV27_16170 [Candidatus Hydrogenedentes bacterium]|nr:hypothetical protein [Candidatus Hydrogenedentota bacterium]
MSSKSLQRLFLAVALLCAFKTQAQAVKYKVPEGAPAPPIMYHGLVPGKSPMADVKKALGEPERATRWYNYKLYYPSEGRAGMYDIAHMTNDSPQATLASVEAASVPAGFESDAAIREKLGAPEYELRMVTWKLLDYSEQGVRFTLDAAGKTTGVAYVPHTYRRVPEGERDLVDLSQLREGPQPAPAKAADLKGLQVGTAERDITPQAADWLALPFTVHDPLKVRLAVFRNAELTVALVGADVFGMGYMEVKAMRDSAKALGVDQMIFGMAHNHASGDTSGFYGYYPEKYIAHIHDQVIDGISDALAHLEPVGALKSANREMPMDGSRVMGLFRNARNPAVLDPTISAIIVEGASGKTLATLVHFACHVESIDKGGEIISADFPGFMCDRIKADGGGQPIFLNGALGGMVSGDNAERTPESAQEMGITLAGIVKDLAAAVQPGATFRFAAEARALELPLTNPTFIALFKDSTRGLHRGRMVTDMTYIEIGEAQFISLPGELLPEVSFEILEQMAGYPRMLVGLGNDQIGYMIPPYDFRDNYYEESVSVGPATAVQVRDMAIRMLAAHQTDRN